MMTGTDGKLRRLYIVQTAFSCPDKRASVEILDDTRREITLSFDSATREKITGVRNKYLNAIRKTCLPFYSLLVVRESDRAEVERLANEAHNEMQAIDGQLHAHVHTISLYLDQKEKGEVYGQVLDAIMARIYGGLFERLKELAKLEEIPNRSKLAILKLCDKMAKWNVVDDPDVAETLANIRLQVDAGILKPAMEDLKKELKALKSRGAYLEFDSNTADTAPAAPIPTSGTEE
jgi:hypothetical protein